MSDLSVWHRWAPTEAPASCQHLMKSRDEKRWSCTLSRFVLNKWTKIYRCSPWSERVVLFRPGLDPPIHNTIYQPRTPVFIYP